MKNRCSRSVFFPIKPEHIMFALRGIFGRSGLTSRE